MSILRSAARVFPRRGHRLRGLRPCRSGLFTQAIRSDKTAGPTTPRRCVPDHPLHCAARRAPPQSERRGAKPQHTHHVQRLLTGAHAHSRRVVDDELALRADLRGAGLRHPGPAILRWELRLLRQLRRGEERGERTNMVTVWATLSTDRARRARRPLWPRTAPRGPRAAWRPPMPRADRWATVPRAPTP